jgi:hypothetical protein
MRRTRWHLVLLVATVVFPLSAAQAQSWEIFENVCNATETEAETGTIGNPISCILGDVVVGVASNSADRRSYSTQQFGDVNQYCIDTDPAHPWFDEVKGYCKVEVYWVEPNTGVNSSMWVRFGDPIENGEWGGGSGLLVYVQTVSCDCYGRRPPSPPP